MLTTKGVVKLLDLGLARLATTEESSDATAPDAGGGGDGHAGLHGPGAGDRFAHGGHPGRFVQPRLQRSSTSLRARFPIPVARWTEKLLNHQTNPPSRAWRRATAGGAPRDVAAVVHRLLAKKPAERYQTPAEVAAALTPYCGNRPPVAIPVGETVAYAPEDQSRENTLTEALTEARPKPVAMPVTTVALPTAKARWKTWLGDRRAWRSSAAG